MDSKQRKVVLRLDPDAWHGSATETIWTEWLGENRYLVENSPFYAFGVSYQDVIKALPQGDELVYDSVLVRGGHSTYRIIKMASGDFSTYWGPLQALGCTYEEGPNGLLSVDLPPSTNIRTAYEKLQDGERAGAWEFEEGHCGHAL